MLLIGLAVGLVLVVNANQNAAAPVSYQDFFNLAGNGSFTEEGVTIARESLTAEVKEGVEGLPENVGERRRVVYATNPENLILHTDKLNQMGVDVKEVPGGNLWLNFLLAFGPIILIALLIYFFFFRALKGAGGGPGGMLGNFGKSKHKALTKEHSNVKLDDVAGVTEAKDEVAEIIDFLRNPKKFQRLGGRVPRGRAAHRPSPAAARPCSRRRWPARRTCPSTPSPARTSWRCSSAWAPPACGTCSSRQRSPSPCIIFLDEIDAVGRRRGNGMSSGGNDEREQTLKRHLGGDGTASTRPTR